MVCPRLLADAVYREISGLRDAKAEFRFLLCRWFQMQVNVAGCSQSKLNVERQTLATFILAAENYLWASFGCHDAMCSLGQYAVTGNRFNAADW